MEEARGTGAGEQRVVDVRSAAVPVVVQRASRPPPRAGCPRDSRQDAGATVQVSSAATTSVENSGFAHSGKVHSCKVLMPETAM